MIKDNITKCFLCGQPWKDVIIQRNHWPCGPIRPLDSKWVHPIYRQSQLYIVRLHGKIWPTSFHKIPLVQILCMSYQHVLAIIVVMPHHQLCLVRSAIYPCQSRRKWEVVKHLPCHLRLPSPSIPRLTTMHTMVHICMDSPKQHTPFDAHINHIIC